MFHFSWHTRDNLNSGVVWCLRDVKAACSRKEIRFLALLEESACKSVAVLKVNNQILQCLMAPEYCKQVWGSMHGKDRKSNS